MWPRVDQQRLHAISRGGRGGGGWRMVVVVVCGQSQQQPSCRREARRGQQKCGLAGARSLSLSGETDRDSLELRETARGNTRGTEGETDYRDRQSRTLGGKHSNKTTTCNNNNTHQHRSAAERSRSREALRHELMDTNHQLPAWLNFASPVPFRCPVAGRPVVDNHILTHTCLIYTYMYLQTAPSQIKRQPCLLS